MCRKCSCSLGNDNNLDEAAGRVEQEQHENNNVASRNKKPQLLVSLSGIGVKAVAVAKMVSWNWRSPAAGGWSDGEDDDGAEDEALWKKAIILGAARWSSPATSPTIPIGTRWPLQPLRAGDPAGHGAWRGGAGGAVGGASQKEGTAWRGRRLPLRSATARAA